MNSFDGAKPVHIANVKPHAEIAGAGITGLMTACVLGQQGWSVRVHERGSEIREIGAGIFLKENAIKALEAVGAFARLQSKIVKLNEGRVYDESGRTLLHRKTESEDNYIGLRGVLHRTLAELAIEAGAEIVVNSTVASAEENGVLILENGRRLPADLVIGADGYRSKIRDSVGLTRRVKLLTEGATRLLIPRTAIEAAPMQQEHWAGRYRVGFAPCSPEDVYVFLMAPERDTSASAIPVNKDLWRSKFPHLSDVIGRFDVATATHAQLALVDVKGWCRGKVAILGDAAHAQPPNLGQGAGLAIANAYMLGRFLAASDNVVQGLAAWENSRRPIGEAVKSWSYTYGEITGHWPIWALPARSAFVWALAHWPPTARRWTWLWRGGLNRGEDYIHSSIGVHK